VLIKDNLADEINKIKQQPGKDIWFLGSVSLAQAFMRLLAAAVGCFRLFDIRLSAWVWPRSSRWRLRSASC
jgi:hypothetical protein